MLDFLFEFQFIQRGIIAGLLVALICPLIGSFLVVRRMSLISEALSHVTLAGVGLGVFLTTSVIWLNWIEPLYMGMLLAIIGAFFIEQLRRVFKQYPEISIPIVLSAGIGFGVILLSIAGGFNAELLTFLFGSIVSVSRVDIWFIGVTSTVVLVMTILLYKELLSVTFDEEFARTSGIPKKWINLLLALLIAFTISVAMRVVGILLVSSLITIPVAAGLRVARSFKQLILYAVLIAESSMFTGILLAYYLEVATGGMVVIMAIFHLLMIVAFQSFQSKLRVKGVRS